MCTIRRGHCRCRSEIKSASCFAGIPRFPGITSEQRPLFQAEYHLAARKMPLAGYGFEDAYAEQPDMGVIRTAECRKKTFARSSGGRRCEDTFGRLNVTVSRETSPAANGKDRLFFTGPTTAGNFEFETWCEKNPAASFLGCWGQQHTKRPPTKAAPSRSSLAAYSVGFATRVRTACLYFFFMPESR